MKSNEMSGKISLNPINNPIYKPSKSLRYPYEIPIYSMKKKQNPYEIPWKIPKFWGLSVPELGGQHWLYPQLSSQKYTISV